MVSSVVPHEILAINGKSQRWRSGMCIFCAFGNRSYMRLERKKNTEERPFDSE
jgi:hypothetical protein